MYISDRDEIEARRVLRQTLPAVRYGVSSTRRFSLTDKRLSQRVTEGAETDPTLRFLDFLEGRGILKDYLDATFGNAFPKLGESIKVANFVGHSFWIGRASRTTTGESWSYIASVWREIAIVEFPL